MKTPYCGRATIGGHPADVDIANVDLPRWSGTVTGTKGRLADAEEAVITLLDQPRPGWNSRAAVTADAEGIVHLEGAGQFFAPRSSPDPGGRSLWKVKSPPTT